MTRLAADLAFTLTVSWGLIGALLLCVPLLLAAYGLFVMGSFAGGRALAGYWMTAGALVAGAVTLVLAAGGWL